MERRLPRIDNLYTSWDLERERRPALAREFWDEMASEVRRYAMDRFMTYDEAWADVSAKLDLRPR